MFRIVTMGRRSEGRMSFLDFLEVLIGFLVYKSLLYRPHINLTLRLHLQFASSSMIVTSSSYWKTFTPGHGPTPGSPHGDLVGGLSMLRLAFYGCHSKTVHPNLWRFFELCQL